MQNKVVGGAEETTFTPGEQGLKLESPTPSFIRLFNRFVSPMIGGGVPFGPNALITVRGRKTGEPRTTPVAVIEVGGRRWIQGAFGEVNWVRNLRAAGEATLTQGKSQESVWTIELTAGEAAVFFAEVLAPYLRRLPPPVRWIMLPLLGLSDVLSDPKGAAQRHPVFELKASERMSGGEGAGGVTSD